MANFNVPNSTDPDAVPVSNTTETLLDQDGTPKTAITERVRLVHGPPGQAQDVTVASPMPTRQQGPTDARDVSPLLAHLDKGSATVGTTNTVVTAGSGDRKKTDIFNVGAVRVWLGFGGTEAIVSQGGYLDPGDGFSEYIAGPVTAIAESGSCLVTFQTWQDSVG